MPDQLLLQMGIWDHHCGIVVQRVKLLSATLAPVSEHEFEFQLPTSSPAPYLMCLERQQKMGQVPGTLTLTWETSMQLLAPSFGLAQPSHRWAELPKFI